jgi:hypothetical protein
MLLMENPRKGRQEKCLKIIINKKPFYFLVPRTQSATISKSAGSAAFSGKEPFCQHKLARTRADGRREYFALSEPPWQLHHCVGWRQVAAV